MFILEHNGVGLPCTSKFDNVLIYFSLPSIFHGTNMTKEKLLKKIRELLKTDNDLDFLLDMKKENLETLIACIRDRVDQK